MVPVWLHLGTLTKVLYRSPSHRPSGTPTYAAGWEGITFFINPRKDLWMLVTQSFPFLPRGQVAQVPDKGNLLYL